MTPDIDFERRVATWLETAAGLEPPDGLLETALTSARGVSQRNGLRAFFEGPTPWPASRGLLAATTVRRASRLALVTLVVLALLAATIYVGSQLRPAPIRLTGVLAPTGAMLGGRFQPFTTVLDDGNVLVTGATGLDEIVEAEVYDPTTGRFQATGSMGVGRAPGRVQAQVRLSDGRVLVVGSTGGQHDGLWPFTPFARVYDPMARSFGDTGTIPENAFDTDATASRLGDGRIEIRPTHVHSPVLVFDPLTRGVAVADDSPAEGQENVATIRLGDGRTLRLFDRPVLHPEAQLEETNGTIVELPVPPVVAGNERYLTLLEDGRVLITGASTAIFDPRSLAFSQVDGGGMLPVTSLTDGRILLEAGDPSAFPPTPRRLWTFDPETDELGQLGDVELPSECCAAWTVLSDGRVLGLGGFDDEIPIAGAWILD